MTDYDFKKKLIECFHYALLMMGLCLLMFVCFRAAHAAELIEDSADLPMTVRIISFEDTQEICGADEPPHWCAEYLSRLEPEAGEPEEQPESTEVYEPWTQDKVYE